MKIYFAPMEGITGLVCRNAYEACFSGSVDKYFAPFITATIQKSVSAKELRDILPKQNKVPCLVPQILANRADAFIKTGEKKGFLYLALQNLWFNWMTKPDFIAYNHKNANVLSRKLCRKLYHNLAVAWTIQSQKELDEAKEKFDLFIFDSFIPKKV